MYRINVTLVYFLLFSIISSFLAYNIITKAYDNAYEGYLTE